MSLFSKINHEKNTVTAESRLWRAPDRRIIMRGSWTTAELPAIKHDIAAFAEQHADIFVRPWQAEGVTALDTAGAWLLDQYHVTVEGLSSDHRAIVDLVASAEAKGAKRKLADPLPLWREWVLAVGRKTYYLRDETVKLISFIGETTVAVCRTLASPRRLRWNAIARHIRETGINAVPIIALMAFLISIVLSYQGAAQLKRFGAEIFTINMLAISLLREMGVLLTAIMIAGRSGSAFTAEIGVMKVNEEVDAMEVMGLSAFDVLVVPRFIALVITLPLLTLVADIMGATGGALVSYYLLDIQFSQYVHQFKSAVLPATFWVGMSKAPVFALLISVVGCMRGLEVSGSAESVGRLTTVSVVHAIFLVLLADALFSILFTKLGI